MSTATFFSCRYKKPINTFCLKKSALPGAVWVLNISFFHKNHYFNLKLPNKFAADNALNLKKKKKVRGL